MGFRGGGWSIVEVKIVVGLEIALAMGRRPWISAMGL